jgi:hypothetical protein
MSIYAGSRTCLRCRYRWGTWIRKPALSWAPVWTTRTKNDSSMSAIGLPSGCRHQPEHHVRA